MSELKWSCDGCDRNVIRTYLAQLASGALRLPSRVPSAASAPPSTDKRSRSTEPDLLIKRLRAAEMMRSGMEPLATQPAKSAGESLQSTMPVQSDTSPGFTRTPRVSARPSRAARSDDSKATSGSSRTPSTQGIASKTQSASQAGNKRAQKLLASDTPLSNTESFDSFEENTLAALSRSRSSLRHRAILRFLPDRRLPQFQWIPLVRSLDRPRSRVDPHRLRIVQSLRGSIWRSIKRF